MHNNIIMHIILFHIKVCIGTLCTLNDKKSSFLDRRKFLGKTYCTGIVLIKFLLQSEMEQINFMNFRENLLDCI